VEKYIFLRVRDKIERAKRPRRRTFQHTPCTNRALSFATKILKASPVSRALFTTDHGMLTRRGSVGIIMSGWLGAIITA